MQRKLFVFLFMLMLIPLSVSADSNDNGRVVAQTTKYYRTVSILSNSEVKQRTSLGEVSSFTTEITQEEYDNFNPSTEDSIHPRSGATIETNYKRLTTTIYEYRNYFNYEATLTWKNIPKVRSFDIIAIGHYNNVTNDGGVNFTQTQCYSANNCDDNIGYTNIEGVNGSAAVFSLPTGTLTSLEQVMDFDVVKTNSNSTITYQEAVGDYSHATSTISYTNAQRFTVNLLGINLNSSITSYYDTTPEATAYWEGTW